jgi:hypothetical protein
MATPEQIASSVLGSWSGPPYEVDVHEVMRRLPRLRLVYAAIGASGYLVEEGIVDRYSYIVVNERHSIERQRFTTAHEIGHYLHRREGIVGLNEEIWCDEFASHLLMPRERLKAFESNIKGLADWLEGARCFRVSKEAFFHRAWDAFAVARFETTGEVVELSRPAVVSSEILNAVRSPIIRKSNWIVRLPSAKIHFVSCDLLGRWQGVLQVVGGGP